MTFLPGYVHDGHSVTFRPRDVVTMEVETPAGWRRVFGTVQPTAIRSAGDNLTFFVQWDPVFGQPTSVARFVHGAEPDELRHALPTERERHFAQTEAAARRAELVRLIEGRGANWPGYVLRALSIRIKELSAP